MSSKLQEWVNATPERQRIYAQEDLILQAGEVIHAAMEKRGVIRARLAERNMTLRRLADIAHALGYRVEIKLKRREPDRVYEHQVDRLAKKETD
jgi:hypothetical protein